MPLFSAKPERSRPFTDAFNPIDGGSFVGCAKRKDPFFTQIFHIVPEANKCRMNGQIAMKPPFTASFRDRNGSKFSRCTKRVQSRLIPNGSQAVNTIAIEFFDRAHEQYYVRGFIIDGEEEERTARGSPRSSRCLPAGAQSGISGFRGLGNVTIFNTIAGAAAIIAWAAMLALRGGFWQLRVAVVIEIPPAHPPLRIVAVMPARNEADVVGDAVRSLLQQSSGSIEVILVDDASSDGTAQAAEAAAQLIGATGLSAICGKPLPAGWTGKLWALEQGIRAADQVSAEWLLLADADVVQGPETVAQLAAIAKHGRYDLVSFMVKLHCDTIAEKLLIPPYVFFFFMLYPPKWVADPQRSVAGAAGGCILVRREALAHAGGITAIRGEIIDDCALARLIKRSGGHVWLGLTNESVSVRGYKSATIWEMIARNAFSQLHHSAWLLAGTVAGMCILYLAPPLLLLSGARLSIALGAAAWLTMTVAYWPTVRYYRLNTAWAFTLPFSAIFYTAATLHSALKYWTGQGGEWKGRVQDRAGL